MEGQIAVSYRLQHVDGHSHTRSGGHSVPVWCGKVRAGVAAPGRHSSVHCCSSCRHRHELPSPDLCQDPKKIRDPGSAGSKIWDLYRSWILYFNFVERSYGSWILPTQFVARSYGPWIQSIQIVDGSCRSWIL